MSRSEAALAATSIALLAGTAGCLEYWEPTSPEEIEPFQGGVVATLVITDTDIPRADLDASFNTGIDSTGIPRSAADPTLRVLQRVIEPSDERVVEISGQDNRLLDYETSWAVGTSEIQRSTVELVGPLVEDGGPRPSLALPLIWRSGPDSIQLDEGERLELPLRGISVGTDADSLGLSWRLELKSADEGRLYTARGNGLPPDTLVVQSGLLSSDLTEEPIEVSLDVAADAYVESTASSYEVNFRLLMQSRWHVTREGG